MGYYAILVAGGKGTRMGGEVPKQFLPIGGRPVLMRTIDSFVEAFEAIHIILVLPESQQEYWHQLCKEFNYKQPVEITSGGATRFHSVKNGLSRIPLDAEGVVGVHDGVRPFVSIETIHRCYQVAEKHGAVVPVIPVVETVRQILSDGSSQTVNRDDYRLVQTPQTFQIQLLKEAYCQPYQPFFTDDASVVEAMGHPITLVEGNRENIKITTPADLKFAEMLVSE
ncbi:MAG: 2-C-methyl-D-erythritol 4-phosphate cytidylyltransferase [Bacteroidaceae bacterium]|nr:2-C-methyl-D-erythritol 4-phosphate cytidylyltransferase [Bacteroidaceae bacterium]